MSWSLMAGLGLALLSTGALNWGFFAQHGATGEIALLTVRRPLRSLGLLLRHPRWLRGFAVGLLGWALYVAALALAPLSLVQAVSAGGIGLLALLVSREGGIKLARRERVGVSVAVLGLALLALSITGASTHGSSGSTSLVVAWLVGSATIAAVLVGPAASLLAGGAGFGLAAGALYAAGDVGTKAALAGGNARLFLVGGVLACHGLAFVAFQLGLQRGSVLASAGLASLCTNALPILAGTTVFGEGLPSGPRGVARLLAFASVVVGAALLAKGRTEQPGQLEPERRALVRDAMEANPATVRLDDLERYDRSVLSWLA